MPRLSEIFCGNLARPKRLDHAVVASTLQVLLDVHLDVEAGDLLEAAVAERSAAGELEGHPEVEREQQVWLSHG